MCSFAVTRIDQNAPLTVMAMLITSMIPRV